MHPERALRVINLLDIPERYRKLCPQSACVVLDNESREILDVIQLYSNVFSESEQYQRLYPNSTSFFVEAGTLATIDDLRSKIEWAFSTGERADQRTRPD